jgi:hypothetical protein
MEVNYTEKLELALNAINAAIGELADVDGMERICEELNMLAVQVEDELVELDSLESKE